MRDIHLLSNDPSVLAMYGKLAGRLAVPLIMPGDYPESATEPTPLLVDADSWAASPAEREQLVDLLRREAASMPVACFGYHLTDGQRAALEAAGAMVAHGPGRSLLRTLAFWWTLEQDDLASVPE